MSWLNETLNDVFINAAENLGIFSSFCTNLNWNNFDDILLQFETHPSIIAIRQKMLVA